MPLFQMRSMIDLLYLLAGGGPDLTEQQPRISLSSAPGFCLDVQWGNPAPGTPVWLWPCDGGDAQHWEYDRIDKTVRNPIYDKCLDVQWGNAGPGTPVWTWDCTGNDNHAQRWTWDPERHVLQNALGTVLAFQGSGGTWGEFLGPGARVWTAERTGGHKGQQWSSYPSEFQPPSTCEGLEPGQGLSSGHSLTSCDGRFSLRMQSNGKLVLAQRVDFGGPQDPLPGDGGSIPPGSPGPGPTILWAPIWAADTVGFLGASAAMRGDGSFVVYDAGSKVVWSSGTIGFPGSRLAVQNDGNAVIYSTDGRPRWASNTCCR
jgi:hypothetical protein